MDGLSDGPAFINVSEDGEAVVRTLMGPTAYVHESQIFVVDAGAVWGASPQLDQCFGGQRNGLCGAAVPGYLWLVTGLNTGDVGFTVELHDGPPPADDSWEEIVEASFGASGEVELVGWAAEQSWPLDMAPGSYRVRYCATGMDEGHDEDTVMTGDPVVDRYLLQFWPAPPAPDAVLKQTSEMAAYWHGWARETPAQPPPPTREELEEEQRRGAGTSLWDVPNADGLARLDRPLTVALGQAGPATQQRIARWATRRACEESELASIDWIASALDAMDRGEPLPQPFDASVLAAWKALQADPRMPRGTVPSLDGRHDTMPRVAYAYPLLLMAGKEEDPLTDAVAALWCAANAYGRDRYPVLFAQARQAFPALGEE